MAKIGSEIPMAKEVIAMTIGDLIKLAAKYNMTCVINLSPNIEEGTIETNLKEE